MSLTQVSTWFANARRRLKKENRVTWETPREATGSDEHETEDLVRGELAKVVYDPVLGRINYFVKVRPR